MPRPSLAVLGGTGQQGGGIARRLAHAGYSVVVGSRDPARAAASIAAWPGALSMASADYGAAIENADVVVLAVPFDAIDALLEQHQGRFRNQALIIDVTVPLRFDGGTVALLDVTEGSAAEHIKARLPSHVRLAATFKTIPAQLLNDSERPLECDEFVCGDSPNARTQTMELVRTLKGLRAVDVGPLARARSMEHLTLLAIAINRRYKIHDARFRIVGV